MYVMKFWTNTVSISNASSNAIANHAVAWRLIVEPGFAAGMDSFGAAKTKMSQAITNLFLSELVLHYTARR
jgi:hypothetical protein